jgi:ribosome-associated protein
MSAATPKPRKRRPSTRLPIALTRAVAGAREKKALDVVVLDLRPSKAFTDFFVICTGATTRQVQAIADGVRESLAAHGLKPSLVEGDSNAEWVLIDYFDFIVHVFTPRTREFYGLDRLWGDAEHVEIPA